MMLPWTVVGVLISVLHLFSFSDSVVNAVVSFRPRRVTSHFFYHTFLSTFWISEGNFPVYTLFPVSFMYSIVCSPKKGYIISDYLKVLPIRDFLAGKCQIINAELNFELNCEYMTICLLDFGRDIGPNI